MGGRWRESRVRKRFPRHHTQSEIYVVPYDRVEFAQGCNRFQRLFSPSNGNDAIKVEDHVFWNALDEKFGKHLDVGYSLKL